MDALMKILKDVAGKLQQQQNEKILQTYQVGQQAFSVTILLCFVSGVFGFGFATLLIYDLSTSIRRLKEATRFIGEGQFDRIPSIHQSRDEVGDLAESFQWMMTRLKVLGEMNLDANPLTRLPGNLAIEKVLLTRLQSEAKFAFCLVDLDNFKAFGDRYGYARGSEVLKGVAQLLVETVKRLGTPTDFVGHIGGDDFVVITEPLRIPTLCESMIKYFDERILDYYDPEDRKRGFIISKDRKDVEQSFAMMTLSIAVVTNEKRVLSSPAQIAEIAAQLKQYAKTFPKSIYVVDQRRSP
jgi:GGDEF domain-containing protein